MSFLVSKYEDYIYPPSRSSKHTTNMLDLTTTASVILCTIFLFIFVDNKWKKSKNGIPLKLPPGPKPLPIIGNLHQISSPPFRCFTDLSKQYGPIMHLKLGETSAVVVSSPEIAKQMLKDLEPSFAHKPQCVAFEIMWYNYSDIAFCPYGDYWRQMRKICVNELLSPRIVRSFQSIRRDEAARLLDSLRESSGSSVNLTERIYSFSSSITSRAAFGGVCRDNEALIKLMMETLTMAGGFEIADLFPSSRIVGALSWTKRRLKTMRRKLDVILDDVIDQHRENPARRSGNGEDLVDVLLRVKEEEKLQFLIANHNIKAVLYDMFIGGTETTATTIDWTMVELIRNPRVMDKAQDEVRQALKGKGPDKNDVVIHNLKYLKLVIKESLRLHPPGPTVPRASHEEHVINGYTIPARAKVMVNIWAIQRDPSFWKDPEEFEPERFENQTVDFAGGDFQYLPFGTGRRICPGITFALASIELALAQLLYNFDWKLPEGVRAKDLDMIENVGLASSRKENLFVVATPYNE
ncbi:premnaspirodiene oxygenase-like [Salvia miltiorrhiza]|uniref:premnaspirodiene oxygenase-like n=1 Tax=Salvia miltiorrhiza TaxID=226208 RepID=UPI0025ABDBD5|nr:premnaspirodiene oxygenase-like [Salvia miltiorrhiza]